MARRSSPTFRAKDITYRNTALYSFAAAGSKTFPAFVTTLSVALSTAQRSKTERNPDQNTGRRNLNSNTRMLPNQPPCPRFCLDLPDKSMGRLPLNRQEPGEK